MFKEPEQPRKRDYGTMRGLLSLIARSRRQLDFPALRDYGEPDDIAAEIKRLHGDGLIEGSIFFDQYDEYVNGEITGLTDEGRAFFALLENAKVWSIILGTLKAADVNLPYPLLKEVCEEIVKRYVISFIPEIKEHV